MGEPRYGTERLAESRSRRPLVGAARARADHIADLAVRPEPREENRRG